MSISIAETRHLAKLAKLSFSEEELARLARELEAIVGYVQQLEELDVEHVPATAHVLDRCNVFREDCVAQDNSAEEILQNAPARKLGYFSVPKVIG
ncbi:MAG: Asp-tRNA(Asn)/Glu-tRNA(Gln) amidotransferase subunit GatC [candidate division KSB1 bacterium]|nr:Asp-tRNA(Asn)/Glu-tRNA(Gln) amidotransferase subunit GatC [candidate division KSB1 bacterium]MDZ7276045.1 Asp-tRNA(Asn)/Glu-tRNA(Gln) amidotransferase subunit GatC [candidate division KSB1 bacterium]MDZ7285673.1 Asp-tRNA(Asn)/Glu-tRNA(Gln) amidotransferase subunit GatC [candidate division KSB1 bacterium]MDZ7298705.1 Asp-tRNA(Asn)/Glu-tRNA(Gln) amidotransferase subunit GatC [candidate division KSB1 bacterium]MDZ7307546.1 Asp-tRNA(Asn)/Glu-tRNA(Gln) amidotransferase subunit GatC [candidate div